MITVLLTFLSLASCFGIAYWLAGGLLTFMVSSQEALISICVLVCLACGVMAVAVARGERSRPWWAATILAIFASVALEQLAPHILVVRIVLAAICGIVGTIILYRTVIRRVSARIRGGAD